MRALRGSGSLRAINGDMLLELLFRCGVEGVFALLLAGNPVAAPETVARLLFRRVVLPVLLERVDDDRVIGQHRAVVLADAAARTELLIHRRDALDAALIARRGDGQRRVFRQRVVEGVLEDDGGVGADFRAHDAVTPAVPGHAGRAVHVRQAHLQLVPLILPGERADGVRRADIAARGTFLRARPNTWNQDRRPQPLQARLEGRRLQRVGRADLHALGAARAGGQELALRQGSGRAHRLVVVAVAAHRPLVLAGAGLRRRAPEHSRAQRRNDTATPQVYLGLRFGTRRIALRSQAQRLLDAGRDFRLNLDHVRRADGFASEALNTLADAVHLLLRRLLLQVVVAAHARLELALHAVDAALHLDIVPQPGDARDQGKQAAVGTQVPTPEPLLIPGQRDDA